MYELVLFKNYGACIIVNVANINNKYIQSVFALTSGGNPLAYCAVINVKSLKCLIWTTRLARPVKNVTHGASKRSSTEIFRQMLFFIIYTKRSVTVDDYEQTVAPSFD